ncbi:MAG: hypothetical protein QFB86_00160 [Patescibacteria group bacterium]|nr:hypothetical protein [Patescibacteria group bacterium]
MLVLSFFSWWYGQGWMQVAHSIKGRLRSIQSSFSVNQLSRTLFAPWRKIISYPGASFQDKVRAWGDNLFSRIIGFVIRISVLIAAAIAIVLTVVLTVIEIVLWPLLPLAVPVLLIAGFFI